MVKKSWSVRLSDGEHRIELDYGLRQMVCVDGSAVEIPRTWIANLISLSNDFPITIGPHSGAVHVRSHGLTKQFDLSIAGRSVTTGEAIALATPMPKWVWPFMGACSLIPLLTIGGGLPVLLGMGGAGACQAIAQNLQVSKQTKILLCAGVTAFCWLSLIVLVLSIAAVAG